MGDYKSRTWNPARDQRAIRDANYTKKVKRARRRSRLITFLIIVGSIGLVLFVLSIFPVAPGLSVLEVIVDWLIHLQVYIDLQTLVGGIIVDFKDIGIYVNQLYDINPISI